MEKRNYIEEMIESNRVSATKQIIADGLEYYTDTILKCLNPVDSNEVPFIIAAMRIITENLKSTFENAEDISNFLYKNVEFEAITIDITAMKNIKNTEEI